jgi:hypothetical protein
MVARQLRIGVSIGMLGNNQEYSDNAAPRREGALSIRMDYLVDSYSGLSRDSAGDFPSGFLI